MKLPNKLSKVKKPTRTFDKLRFKKPKKVNKSKLKRKLDELFSLHVRSYGKCELYGIGGVKCSNQLQTMHIISRSNLRLRWDDNNVLCGCSGHHRYYTTHPYEFIKMIEEYFPSKDKYIKEHKNEVLKATPDFYIQKMKDILPY